MFFIQCTLIHLFVYLTFEGKVYTFEDFSDHLTLMQPIEVVIL